MGNELKIMLGSGIVIILTDYFKMIGEETRKNRSVIGDIIKSSLLSLGVIIFLGLIQLYGYNPHLYREFSEKDLDTYATIFFANIVFFMAFISLFNWMDRFLVKYVYYKFKSKFKIKRCYYFVRLIVCALLPLYFVFFTSNNNFKVFKEDVVVVDELGQRYLVKEKTTFDFEYVDNESKSDKNKKSVYEADDSIYILKKGSELKLLRGSKIYPLDEKALDFVVENNKKSSKAIYTLSGKSIMSLNGDEIFTLEDDVNISLAQKNEYKILLEQLFYFLCSLQIFYSLIIFLYWEIMPSINGMSKSKENVWKLSEHVDIFTSMDMLKNNSQDNSYDSNSFLEDKNKFYNLEHQEPEKKCELGDIIVNCKNYEATIVSQNNEGKTDLSAEFLLLRVNDKSIRSEYLLFIIQNYLNNNTGRMFDQKDLSADLSMINLKLPSKIYQKLVGQEYKVYLQKELLLEEHYKDVVE